MSSYRRDSSGGHPTKAERGPADRELTVRFDAEELEPSDEEQLDIELPRNGVLDRRYRVLDRVGDGGMGVVLRARDLRLDREVALKLIRPALMRERELVDQFLAEARAMAALRHPNVVEVFDFGEHQGLPYFVMRFVDGPDLYTWVTEQQSQPLPVDVALGLLTQVCEGVAAIHDAGVIHRDIKPENMLLDHGFRVVVTDFGLVSPIAPRSASCNLVAGGTAGYMAPELAREESLLPDLAMRTDVYALGILAYWLLAGRHPFEAKGRKQMLDLQVRARVVPPSEHRPDLARELDTVVLGALHKDPRQRIASARQLADELRLVRQRLARPKPRIVVVEEDERSRTSIESTLYESLEHVEIIGVPRAEVAFERIESDPPSLVIAALENRGIGGIQLARRLRSHRNTRQVPLIIVSSSGGAREWQTLWQIGVQGFLLKPLTHEAFVPLVRGLLPAQPPRPRSPLARPRAGR